MAAATATVVAATAEAAAEPVGFGPVTDKNVEQVRVLNEVSFPLRYNERFYGDLAKKGRNPDLAVVAYYGYDVLCGAVCGRVEGDRLYIMTLAVLRAYQRRGIGARLLQQLLANVRAKKVPGIASVFLHVHVANEAAVRFYKRHGFEVEAEAKGYYKNLSPPDAVVLALRV